MGNIQRTKVKMAFRLHAVKSLRRCFCEGFSTFEMLVVAAILAIVGAAAIPHLMGWRSNMRLISVVDQLRADLETAKALAAKENTTITMEFQPASGQYRMTYMNKDGNIVAIKTEQLPQGVRIDSTHPGYTLTGHKTSFNSRGGADNGTIVLSNSKGKSRKISISIIGKIEVRNG